eukprot:TRINITY_DN43622_c0_g1_i1.p1 TRINITY_DN43622_c0_g1~~TRINITY_DN43622_c0_g1_i1.p1  ORF type:complete len:474 (+),score=129.96 TRINITY_DN43622_c0_g1_i1:121-1542(+)
MSRALVFAAAAACAVAGTPEESKAAVTCIEAVPGQCGLDMKQKNWGCGESVTAPSCLDRMECVFKRTADCWPAGMQGRQLPEMLDSTVKKADDVSSSLRTCGVTVSSTNEVDAKTFCMDPKQECLDQWRCLSTQANSLLGYAIIPVSRLPSSVSAMEQSVSDGKSCMKQVEAKCDVQGTTNEAKSNCLVNTAYNCAQSAGLLGTATSGKLSMPSLSLPTIPDNMQSCMKTEVEACLQGDDTACKKDQLSAKCTAQVQCGVRAVNKCWGKDVLPTDDFGKSLTTKTDCIQKSLGDVCGYNDGSTSQESSASRTFCGMKTMMTCTTDSATLANISDTTSTCMDSMMKSCGMKSDVKTWACATLSKNGDSVNTDQATKCLQMVECASNHTESCASTAYSSIRAYAVPQNKKDEDSGSGITMKWWIWCLAAVGFCIIVAVIGVAIYFATSKPQSKGPSFSEAYDLQEQCIVSHAGSP